MLNSTCFGVILQINHRLMNRTFLMIQPKIKEIILETLQAKVQHQQLSKDQSPVRPKGQNSKCGEEVSGCQSLKYVHGLGSEQQDISRELPPYHSHHRVCGMSFDLFSLLCAPKKPTQRNAAAPGVVPQDWETPGVIFFPTKPS